MNKLFKLHLQVFFIMSLLLVSCADNKQEELAFVTTEKGGVSIINLENYEVTHQLENKDKPRGVGITRDGQYLVTANKGSASIKDVLPVFKPELSYSDLDIQKGDAASRLWKEVTIEKPNSSNSNKVYSDLIDYCKRDTLAMVEIHRELEKMVK